MSEHGDRRGTSLTSLLSYIGSPLTINMGLSPKWYQFLVSVFASLGSSLYGYDLGVIAEAIASPNFKSNFGDNPNKT